MRIWVQYRERKRKGSGYDHSACVRSVEIYRLTKTTGKYKFDLNKLVGVNTLLKNCFELSLLSHFSIISFNRVSL